MRSNPDRDGLINLHEYAFASDPKAADAGVRPLGSLVVVEGQKYGALTFRRLILGYELNYGVEGSSDLEAWAAVTEPVGAPQLNADGTQTVTIRDTLPVTGTGQRFRRRRVSRQ